FIDTPQPALRADTRREPLAAFRQDTSFAQPLPALPPPYRDSAPPLLPRSYGLRAAVMVGIGLVVMVGIVGWFLARRGDRPGEPTPSPRPAAFLGVILQGGGSTFVDHVMQRWSEVYEKTHGVRIDYRGVGSSAGIEAMLNGVYLFGCSDFALTDLQMEKVAR